MLQTFGEGIWIAEGPELVAAAGFHYPTRMALIRLRDGSLFIWSPVTLTPELKAEVDALGPVAHIVAPNTLHHLSIPEWKSAFPEAKLHAAPGLKEKRSDISFDSELGDAAPPAWGSEIEQAVIPGNAITTETVFLHRESGTVLFCDLIQHFPKGWFSGWRGVVAKLDLMVAAEPAVPRKFRVAFRDKHAAREAVSRILAWDTRAVLMAHGTPVTADAKGFLARAFHWLMG